jgi:hypothetical protein
MAAGVAAFGSIAFDRERDFCLKGLASSSILAQLLLFFASQFGKRDLDRDLDLDLDLDSDLSILY